MVRNDSNGAFGPGGAGDEALKASDGRAAADVPAECERAGEIFLAALDLEMLAAKVGSTNPGAPN